MEPRCAVLLLLPAEAASEDIPIPEVRWHASSFKFPNERRTTANEGDTVNLYLEIVDVTEAWLNHQRPRPIGLRLTRVGGDATGGGVDYSFPYTVWIGSDSLAATIAVKTTDDELIEGTEAASVCFEPNDNQNISYYPARRCAQIDISDNDTAIISVAGGTKTRTVAEGEALELEFTLDKKPARTVSIDVGTTDGGTNSDDYTLTPSSISFSPSAESLTRTVTLQTTDDNVVEDRERLKLWWRLGSNMGHFQDVVRLEGRNLGVLITDDDTSALTLESSPEPVPEGSEVTLTARLSNPIQAAYDVDWWVTASLGDFPGEASFNDLQDVGWLTTGSLRFPSLATSATFKINTVQDTLVEGDETFLVFLQEVGKTLKRTNGRVVTIADDDMATVSVTPTSVSVPEGSAATLAVRLDAAPKTDVKVSWSTSDGTATAGTDYTAQAATTLTFASGETEKTITAQTTDDEALEGDETFNVELSTVEGGLATLSTSTVPVTIEDDDGSESVQVSGARAVGAGGGGKPGQLHGEVVGRGLRLGASVLASRQRNGGPFGLHVGRRTAFIRAGRDREDDHRADDRRRGRRRQ